MDFRDEQRSPHWPAYNAFSEGERNDNAYVCYQQAEFVVPAFGLGNGDNILQYAFPLFILQIAMAILLTRTFHFMLRPLGQQRIISEILAGVVLGPSGLGFMTEPRLNAGGAIQLWPWFTAAVFPLKGMNLLETAANVGLIYSVFLTGVETDFSMIKQVGKKAFIIAMSSLGISFLGAYIVSRVANDVTTYESNGVLGGERFTVQVLVLGSTSAATGFPTIARILTDHKLLHTELGRITMASSIIVDSFSWIILCLTVIHKGIVNFNRNFSRNKEKDPTLNLYKPMYAAPFLMILFVLFCVYVIRPFVITRLIRRYPEGENFTRSHLHGVLVGVMTCALVTEWIGFQGILGAFVFGLTIPNGPLALAIIEKVEDFMCGILVPLFYIVSGLKVNLHNLNDKSNSHRYQYMVYFTLASTIIRTGVIQLIAIFQKMQLREGVTLGLLMNTKGVIQIMMLNICRDRKLIGRRTFYVGMLYTILVTSTISPLVKIIYKSARGFISYKHRTFQTLSKAGVELRVVVGVHMPRQVPAITNLLETSHPSSESPIGIYALHLVELSGRGASAMLTAHGKSTVEGGALTRTQAQSDHIVRILEGFEQKTRGVYVQILTVVSPYSTMHEDICNLAEDKRATFILLPFHKQLTIDGSMEVSNPEYRKINESVLGNAPCTVGILIDRGLATNQKPHHIAMLFFGGPDDREALTYARRMAGHPGLSLTVIRYLSGDNLEEDSTKEDVDEWDVLNGFQTHNEKKTDEDYIRRFRKTTALNESITYTEQVLNSVNETVKALNSIDSIHDLYIVGRGRSYNSSLTDGLGDWSENPELGTIGDLLVCSEFKQSISVLVISCYVGSATHKGDGWSTPDSDHSDIPIARHSHNSQH